MTLPEYVAREEATIARKLVKHALASNYLVSVHDGEEWALKRSSKANDILAAMASTDMDNLALHTPDGEPVGRVLLIWGNGEDLISDYSAPTDAKLDALDAWIKRAGL